MSARVGRRAAWRLVAAAVGLAIVAITSRFLPLLLSDSWIRVHAHNGRWVLKPCLVIPADPGEPPAFESRGWSAIEIPADLAWEGREFVASGPGCGLLSGKLTGESRLTLPPPIRATIRVPGEFPLPSGDHGIALRFQLLGVDPEVATVANCAPVASTHWGKPESPLWDERIWIDPATRAVSVLLPCPGKWRVEWIQIDRPPDGEKAHGFSIVFGKGESVLTIASDGEELALEIDPEALDPDGFRLDDRENAADAK